MFAMLYITVYAIVYFSQAASPLSVNPIQDNTEGSQFPSVRQVHLNSSARAPVVNDTQLPAGTQNHDRHLEYIDLQHRPVAKTEQSVRQYQVSPGNVLAPVRTSVRHNFDSNNDPGSVYLGDNDQKRPKDGLKMQSNQSLSNTGVQASIINGSVSVSSVDITGNTTRGPSLHDEHFSHEVQSQKQIQKLGAEPLEQSDDQTHMDLLGGKELGNQSVDSKLNGVQDEPPLQSGMDNSDVRRPNTKPILSKLLLPSENATSMTETSTLFKVLDVKPSRAPKEPVKSTERKSGEHDESYQAVKVPEGSFTNDNVQGATDLSKASENLETQVKQNSPTEEMSSLGLAMKAAKAQQKFPMNQMSDGNIRESGPSAGDDVGGEPEKNILRNRDLPNPQLSKQLKATIKSVGRADDDPEISRNAFNVPSVPFEYVLLSVCILCFIVLLLWKRCWYVICTVCCKQRQHPIGNVSGRYKVTYKPL